MILLKSSRRRSCVLLGLDEGIHFPAKGGIGQHALESAPRNRLQDHPRIVHEFPQRGIKLQP